MLTDPALLAASVEVHGNPWLFVVIPAIAIGLFILNRWQVRKRREAMQMIARQLGFSFSPDRDRTFASRYGFLDHMDNGSNRYAYNILSGSSPDGEMVHIFDYHYETHSHGSKGKRRTHHHYRSIFTLALPKSFPELNIEREGFFSKIAQSLGFDDIDFESLEFSKRYKVKSNDKKFAYDFCNAQMIDYLLGQQDFIIEVEGDTLALTFKGKLATGMIHSHYQRLLKIRSLMPDYLFNR